MKKIRTWSTVRSLHCLSILSVQRPNILDEQPFIVGSVVGPVTTTRETEDPGVSRTTESPLEPPEKPLNIVTHARIMAGWDYSDSRWITPIWPQMCSNPRCRELLPNRKSHRYHWGLQWSLEENEGKSSSGI
jgi:hypothetical protein